MNGEIDAVGGLVTGSMVAHAVDKTGSAGELQVACPNCDTPITGNFCSNCGQHAHIPRSISHIFEELMHGVLHFDSRAWRTLPMLVFQPGRLTREYVEGKRARYVTPFAMFLFTVFLMYFTFAFLAPVNLNSDLKLDLSPPEVAELEKEIETNKRALAALEKKQQRMKAANRDVSQVDREVAGQQLAVSLSEAALDRVRKAQAEAKARASKSAPASSPPKGVKPNIVTFDGNWQEELAKVTAKNPNLIKIRGNPELERKLNRALRDPEFLFYKMQQSAYKFSFLLVPLSLPFVWILFAFRRNTHVYDHAVFTLYSLSFMSLLFIVLALVTSVGLTSPNVALPAALYVPPVHMFVQLKGAYGLGWFGALVRTGLLSLFAIVVLAIFFLIVLGLGALG